MDLRLQGKTALVTGSSAGIGQAIAGTLAREGANVVVHGRSEDRARRVAQEIQMKGGKVAVAIGDLSSDDEASQAMADALSAFGGIDIVVNNAGSALEDSWSTPDPGQWSDAYNTNVISMVRIISHLLPQMKERGWGRFIQIASIAAHSPQPTYGAYGAAKAGVVNLTSSLASDLAGTGITSNAISPGVILSQEIQEWVTKTAQNEGWEGEWPDFERRFTAGFMPNLVGRMGRPEEIADLVTFIASSRADYITGAHFSIDGGQVTKAH